MSTAVADHSVSPMGQEPWRISDWKWLSSSRDAGPLYWSCLRGRTHEIATVDLWVLLPNPPRQIYYEKYPQRLLWQVNPTEQTVTLLEHWFLNPAFGEWRPARFVETPVPVAVLADSLSARLLTTARGLLQKA